MGPIAPRHVGSSHTRDGTRVPCIGRCILFSFFFFKFIYLCMYVCMYGYIGSLLLCAGFSLVAASGGCSSLWCAGFSLRWLLLLRSTGSRAQAQQPWRTGPAAPRHVGSSRIRARTRVSCTGRRALNHCTTREAQSDFLFLLICWEKTVWLNHN